MSRRSLQDEAEAGSSMLSAERIARLSEEFGLGSSFVVIGPMIHLPDGTSQCEAEMRAKFCAGEDELGGTC